MNFDRNRVCQQEAGKAVHTARELIKAHGAQRAKKIMVVMAALRAAPNMGLFGPPYSPPHRCHELRGNKKGCLSLDLDGPYRLLIQPMNDPLPTLDAGGLDWNGITAIKILGVEDTHG